MDLGPTRVSPAGWQLIITNIILLSLAVVSIGLRLYARKLRGKALCFNDYVIVLSLVFSAGYSTIEFISIVHGGLGFDAAEVIETMGYGSFDLGVKCLMANAMVHPASTTLVRVSIVHFYMTIFPIRIFRTLAYVIIGLIVAMAMAIILYALLNCRPFAYSWDKTIPNGTCESQLLAFLIPVAFNFIADVAVFMMPLPLLWTLQMGLLRKISISLIFSLGIVVCITSGLRIKATSSLDFENITGSISELSFWATLELFLGIINACLPLLRPIAQACCVRLKTMKELLHHRQEKGGMPLPVDEQLGLQGQNTTTSRSTRMFRRLYDHLYPPTQSSRLGSEFTRVDSETGVSGLKPSSTTEMN